jgi:hypothetical protein
MALSHRSIGADAQMPDVHSSLCRAIHRHWHQPLHRPMDPDFNAGILFEFAGISRHQILAQAVTHIQNRITTQSGRTLLI